MRCQNRESKRNMLLSSYENLEKTYEDLVDVINKVLEQETTRVNPVEYTQVKCYNSGELIKRSPSEESVLELLRKDWVRVFAYDRSAISAFAIYLPRDGKIYLKKDEWCLCNFIHEALHSVSVFSKKNGPYRNLKFVYEGITELLTGLLLKSEFNECFSRWTKKETCFLKAYRRWVKMWNYFVVRIGIQDVLNVYFNCSVMNPYSRIIDLMVKKGFEIPNVFADCDMFTDVETRFTTELSEIFGPEFDEYLSSDLDRIDPGKI